MVISHLALGLYDGKSYMNGMKFYRLNRWILFLDLFSTKCHHTNVNVTPR